MRPVTERGVGRRERLSGFGAYFAVDVHDPGSAPGDGWRPVSDLVDDPGVLRARAEEARAVLAAGRPAGAVELRVAASVVHLGLTARLLSPLLALAALDGVDRVPALADLRRRGALGGAFPLSLPRSLLEAPSPAVPDDERWAADVVAGPLADLSRAVAALVPSAHTRRGNIASAVHGAVTVLTAGRPHRRVRDLAALLLARPELRAAATGEPGTPGFRRRNCCLIYRAAVPAPGAARPARPARPVCGDCVLTRPPRRDHAIRDDHALR